MPRTGSRKPVGATEQKKKKVASKGIKAITTPARISKKNEVYLIF
jgi:hypothetical protein